MYLNIRAFLYTVLSIMACLIFANSCSLEDADDTKDWDEKDHIEFFQENDGDAVFTGDVYLSGEKKIQFDSADTSIYTNSDNHTLFYLNAGYKF